MPFRETSVDEAKIRFIADYMTGERSMTELCREHGLSREWGYEMVGRWHSEGLDGLRSRSRAPHHHGRSMAPETATAIVALRREHPTWGPKKLRVVLTRSAPERSWPAASTIGDLLRREGLVVARRRQRRPRPLSRPFGTVQAANDLWCIDFKGWFRTADGKRCDPLTLSDAHSRFLLANRIVAPTTEGVGPVIEEAFRAWGLPVAIRSDNGPPFAGQGAGGLTRLAVSWVKLGIRLERTDPASPQQNARHERMHGTLKRDTLDPPAADPAAQQRCFDLFRDEFNHVRPHEALGQTTPAEHYGASGRSYPTHIDDPAYPDDHKVRRVRSNGAIKWKGDMIFLSEALAGEAVALVETASGNQLVRFADIPLATIDPRTRKLHRFAAARPGRRKPEQTKETVNDVSGP
jgi:transposase InsO family protein